VMRTPEVTRAPDMPSAVEGMVSLRGVLVPVVDIAKYAGIETGKKPEILIVTEYNGHTQGFLVESVDIILRLDWSAMKVPPEMLTAKMGGLVTAVTELNDGRLVMLLDVEKILSETSRFDDSHLFVGIQPLEAKRTIFFADDSSVARKQIENTLNVMNIDYMSAVNGKQAWDELQLLAARAEATHTPLKNVIQLILTDVEMPEMDGYLLTKKIKSDPRFAGIPVIMHSSLSGTSNQQLGQSVGVDEYVSKFEPHKLAATLTRRLA
ncbi:MAG: chemotaxis protein, partial [Burkholderiales bacterium]